MLRTVAKFVLLGVTMTCGGCYQQIIDAVVDDSTDPGGSLTVQINGGTAVGIPASGMGDPLAITAQSTSLVVALTARTDPTGLNAATVLATAGGHIAVTIAPDSGNQLQVHSGGTNCIADTGTITLTANSDGSLSGTYDASGTVMGSGAPVTLTGTLTAVPSYH